MFTDIQIARRSAYLLSKTLMVPTVVISIGREYVVTTADEVDPEDQVVNQFDPFA